MSIFSQLSRRPEFNEWTHQLYNAFYPIQVRLICDDWIEAQLARDLYRDILDELETTKRALQFTNMFIAVLSARYADIQRTNYDPSSHDAIQIFQAYVQTVDPYAVYKQAWDTLWIEKYLLATPTTTEFLMDAEAAEFSHRSRFIHAQIMTAKGKYSDYINAYLEWYKHNQSSDKLSIESCSNELVRLINSIVSELLQIQNFVLTRLTRWKCAQAKSSVEMVEIPDKFQTWFDTLAFFLTTTRNTIHGVQLLDNWCEKVDIYSNINFQVINQMKDLVMCGFIVEKQPKQVIKTKTKCKSTAVVRMLARNFKGIREIQKPVVTVSIVSENNIRLGTDHDNNVILNRDVVLDLPSKDGLLQWSFNNILVQKVKRCERKQQDTVSDDKFALLFQAQFRDTKVAVLSLPVVVVVHVSQYPQAWATISWDNAFSDFLHRDLFQVPEQVPWSALANMLNKIFEQRTGRQLSNENLLCLYCKLMGTTTIDCDPDQKSISWKQFCKDTMYNAETKQATQIRFWDWFYAAMQKTKEIREFWVAGHIEGFISKAKAWDKLNRLPERHGLIRISDSELGAFSIASTYINNGTKSTMFYKVDLGNLTFAQYMQSLDTFDRLPSGETITNAFRESTNENNAVVSRNGYTKLLVTIGVNYVTRNGDPGGEDPNGSGSSMHMQQ